MKKILIFSLLIILMGCSEADVVPYVDGPTGPPSASPIGNPPQ